MEPARPQRYLDKPAHLERRCRQAQEWAARPDFQSEERTRLAVYKSLQEAVETAMDLFAMRLRDLGLSVAADYSNVEVLERAGQICSLAARCAREANGLRNRLVHA